MKTKVRLDRSNSRHLFLLISVSFILLCLLIATISAEAEEVVSVEVLNAAIVDSEKPIIDVDSLQVDKAAATVGDSVLVSVMITDNESLARVVISFDNIESGKMIIYQPMHYDETSDRWQYRFEVTENTSNGAWEISGIQAYDEVGNVDVVAPHIRAITVYGAADSEKPIIYINTLSVSKETATVGEDIVVSLKVTDNESLGRVLITFDNLNSGKMVLYQPMTYSADDDLWKYTFSVSDSTPNGVWILNNIQAYDTVGNASIEMPKCEVFTIYDAADSEKPVIYSDSLSVSAETATYDDHVIISIAVTDNVGISRVVITLDNRETGKMILYQPMVNQDGSDVWIYDFYIAEDIPDGVWELSNIQAYDEAGNASIIAPHSAILTTDHIFDFSKVSGLKLPAEVEVIETEAFMGCNESIVVLPSACHVIQSRSFAQSENLHRIWIPDSVATISQDAFEGCPNVIIYGLVGSYAEQYAEENNISFVLNE